MYLNRTNQEYNSTFISWMDDQSLCARDSRAVNTPQLHLMKTNIYSPTRYDKNKEMMEAIIRNKRKEREGGN